MPPAAPPPTPVPAADHALAAELAGTAGKVLLELRASGGRHPQLVKDEGDRRAHVFIAGRLREERPHDGLLSEEGHDDRGRLALDRVWVVDPLDGTREFGEPGRVDWAVHIALAVGGSVAAAAVALPAEDLVFATDPAPTPPPAGDRRLRVATSRTRRPLASTVVAEALDAELVPMGSAGAKAMAVVRGDVDAYAHAGGMYEWDSAAPTGVAAAAGLHVSRIDGSPLTYNHADPWLPDLLICRPELADACLAALLHC
ncbi:MAG TPA: 3'(2'),5'-bisphosphate nucleotidase CysQ [Acidimicrobiales bacterium]|nr:3'(2'),5'-bisphosphate nucleotidase CysQ [Acidimicrobiales bacterium]